MAWNLPEGTRVLLDACCLINFLATGRLEDILRTLPCEFATSRFIVTNEVLSLKSSPVPGVPTKRESISSERLERLDCLTILEAASEDEVAEAAWLAKELDGGEASIYALAVTRGGAVATDDVRALRVLRRLAPEVPTVQTPELLYEWAHLARLSNDEIGKALWAVKQRAHFHPRRDAPQFDWWSRHLL
jgi:hypothetical protein